MAFDIGGLLGSVFNADNPAQLYGGLLSDPATQRALAWRGFMGATQKAGELAMPTRMPLSLGAVLGQVGGAIGPAEDAAIKARSEEAGGLLARNQANAFPELIKAYKDYQSLGGGGSGAPAPGTGTAAPGSGAPAPGSGGSRAVSSMTADDTLPKEARALLDTISGPESGGGYGVRWGGSGGDKTFSDFSQHPRIFEPGPAGPSSAAGRYQITASTWDPLAAKYGFKDFQPATQDQAAWHLAADTYQRKTGRDLLADLQGGDTSRVEQALRGEWITFRLGTYDKNLSKYQGGGQTQTASTPPTAPPAPLVTPPTAGAEPPPDPKNFTPVAGPKAGKLDQARFDAAQAAWKARHPDGAPQTAAVPPVAMPPNMDPTSAAPPRLAQPPAAAPVPPVAQPPGPAAAAGPALSPAAQAIAAGMQRAAAGGPVAGAQFAGPGAAEPPSAAPPAMAPHTGAAGAAELQQLLGQPPAPLVQPPAPAPNVPPPAAQPLPGGAQAPPPPQMPTAPPPPTAALPSLPATPLPGQPGAGLTPEQQQRAAAARTIAGISSLLKMPVPDYINKEAGLPLVGAEETAKRAAAFPFEVAQKQYQSLLDINKDTTLEGYKKNLEATYAGYISAAKEAGALPYNATIEQIKSNLQLRNELAKLNITIDDKGNAQPINGFAAIQAELERQKTLAQKQTEQDVELKGLPLRQRIEAQQKSYTEDVEKPARNAEIAKQPLIALQNSLNDFRTGATADTRLALNKAYADILGTFGMQASPEVQRMIAAGETINKQGNTLGYEMARSLGSRESQMVVQQAISSNPGLKNSPQGNQQLISLMMAGLQRDMDKQNFYDNYFRSHGNSYDGAREEFQKAHPVEVTVSHVPGLEYKLTDPSQLKNLPKGAYYSRPNDINPQTGQPNIYEVP